MTVLTDISLGQPDQLGTAGIRARVDRRQTMAVSGLTSRHVSGGYLWLKAVVEWSIALVLLVISLPLLGVLAILISLTSDGPAVYSQWRVGRSGKRFCIYKLRTMTHGCEAGTGPVWAITDDPRATTIGRWLRDTHLDELPQLWNVLCGHMSLIGPRPERPEISEQIEQSLPQFRDRLVVKPGITGLSQMCLSSDSDLDTVRRKLVHDLYYIEHLGPSLDLRLALATPIRFIGDIAVAMSRRMVQPTAASAPISSTSGDKGKALSGSTPELLSGAAGDDDAWMDEMRAAA